jgi:UDP-glucose 4-epimerase
MILVTGGAGFIGLNVGARFVEVGERVVLTQHRARRDEEAFKFHAEGFALIESLDVTNAANVREVMKRHQITDVVHLASPPARLERPEGDRELMDGLMNILECANDLGVRRVSVASSIWVYASQMSGPFREDSALSEGSTGQDQTFRRIETQKRKVEATALAFGKANNLDVLALRIARAYGPWNNKFMAHNAPSRFAALAAFGSESPFETSLHALDEGDWCYVKDIARGIQLLQAAECLEQSVFNVGSGRATSTTEIAEAARAASPGLKVELEPGASIGAREHPYMDLQRIREAVGYEPEYNITRGITDYIDWLHRHSK